MSPLDPEVPPAGEEVHLPGGSVQPILLATAITVAIVGITTNVALVIAGAWLLLRRADRRTALRLYLFSLAYLALLFGAMVADVKL